MTAAEYFKQAGRGSMRKAATATGYTIQHIYKVVKDGRTASPFFIQCLEQACPGIDTSAMRRTNGPLVALPRVIKQGKYSVVMLGKKYIKQFKTRELAEQFIKGLV